MSETKIMAKEPEKYVRKKIRKPRKPMSAEQKAAAVERLAKAREKRMKENPPTYKNIHQKVLDLPEDDPLHMSKVKEWIKHQREIASVEGKNDRAGVKGALAKKISAEGYARNMQRYLESGDWCDMFYGKDRQSKMRGVCLTLAYHPDGSPKRTHGVFYPDIGYVWGVPEDEGGVPAGWAEGSEPAPAVQENAEIVGAGLSNLEDFFGE